MGPSDVNSPFVPPSSLAKIGPFFCQISAHFLFGVSPKRDEGKRVCPANCITKRVTTRRFTRILKIILRFLAIFLKHLPTRRLLSYF